MDRNGGGLFPAVRQHRLVKRIIFKKLAKLLLVLCHIYMKDFIHILNRLKIKKLCIFKLIFKRNITYCNNIMTLNK